MTDQSTTTSPTLTANNAPVLTVMKQVKFGFKKADPITDVKRPPVELEIPILTLNGLIEFLQPAAKEGQTAEELAKVTEKNQKFILSLAEDVIREAARQQVADDVKPVNKQEELDFSKLDLTYIANLPPSERRAGGIDKEVWEKFGVVYNAKMPALTGKSAESVANASILFLKKLLPCKSRKEILAVLKPQLDTFYNGINEEEKEEFAPIYEFLVGRLDTYLNADEMDKVMENL